MSLAQAIDKYIMSQPIERAIAVDWQGGDVYQGDQFRIIDGDIVLEDDIVDYLDTKWGEVQTA